VLRSRRPTATLAALFHREGSRTSKPPIGEIFESRSVAVIGASSRAGNLASRIVQNLITLEFGGDIHVIGRSDDELFGLPVYRSVLDVPTAPDLAVIAVPAQLVAPVLEECGRKGVRFATITTAGFGEYDAANGLDEQLLTIAGDYGIRFIGPNCQGIRDFESGLSTRFGRQQKQAARHVMAGLIAQSGTISSTFERFLKAENVGITRLASLGNKLNVDESDLLPVFLAHETTKIVFMYLEGIRRGRALFDVANGSPKPIVLFKGNISPAAARIARSHSASVLNATQVADAAARQAGMISVQQFADCALVANAFLLPPMHGDRLVIFGGSGGMGVIGADWAYRTGFDLVPLPEATAAGIEARLRGDYLKIANPVDIGDFFDVRGTLAMIESIVSDPVVDGMLVCMFDMTKSSGEFHNHSDRPFAVEIIELMERYGKPIALVYAADRESLRTASAESGIPIFAGADEAIRALRVVRDFQHRRELPADPPATFGLDTVAIAAVLERARARGAANLSYDDGFRLLAAAGITVAMPQVAKSVDEAVNIARNLGGPVSMKLVPDDGAHKTELGGVRLGVRGDEDVRAAYTDLRARHTTAAIALQPMVSGSEVMLGGRHDEHFGAVVSVGLGGTYVELMNDAALRLAPFGAREAAAMLDETKAGRLLAGWRGAPPSDREAVIEALQRLGALLSAYPEITEVDVNPFMVGVAGRGACAVDARVFIGEQAS
jgi:acyl-CoA synthetase (NDP forming)